MTPYLLLITGAFGAQALMFVPIVPMLIATGALVAHQQVRPVLAWTSIIVGVAAGDFLWYVIGRGSGRAILGRLCRIALEPSTCLRRAERLFGRYGAAALMFAKFVPGLSTVALPLAGAFGMRPRRFVAFDAVGVLLWTSAYMTVGYLSSAAIRTVGSRAPWAGRDWIVFAATALVTYAGVKAIRRQAIIRQLRVARITVEELHRRLEAGERLCVIDLRHPLDYESDPYVIPGARYIPAEELGERQAEIPHDREIVLYCTCPDEITSAQEAMRLRRFGIRNVRPLQGGLSAWRAAEYPLELRGPIVPVDGRILNAA
jgi:membrane protein DedA with SNARE-associated domain/rhodanese-related sulfurtransferase